MRRLRVPAGTVELAVLDSGPSDAPAVLLGHGVGSTAAFVTEAFGAPLRKAGWRLLAYDLRGHGGSTPVPDPAGHALDRHVADLAFLVDRFAPAVVGGVSLGGQVGVAFAARGGPCDAVLSCLPAWTGRAVPGEGPHAVVAAEVARLGVDGMVRRFANDTTMVPWLRDVLLRDWPRHDPDSLAAALTALDGGLAPTVAELRTLPVPLALVSWAGDPGHPDEVARLWERTAPRAHHVSIDLAGVGDDRTRFGQAATIALAALGVTPPGVSR